MLPLRMVLSLAIAVWLLSLDAVLLLASAPPVETPLRVVAFSVSPKAVSVGEAITIVADVMHTSSSRLTNVVLVPGLAAGANGAHDWTMLDASRAGPVPELLPDSQVKLRVVVQVGSAGWPKIGAIVVSDQASTPRLGAVVRVGPIGTLLQRVMLLSVIFCGIGWATALAVSWAGLTQQTVRSWRLIVADSMVMGGSVATWLWSPHLDARAAWLGLVLVLFISGWLCCFVALLPGGRRIRGAMLGTFVYALVGLAWFVVHGAGIERLTPSETLSTSRSAHLLLWPFDLFQLVAFS